MEKPQQITIDGPASSGKSTVAALLATELGYLFFDTGVMYRAVTYAYLKSGLSLTDESGISALAERMRIDIRPPTVDDKRQNDILLDGEDITWQIRTREVDDHVSPISVIAGVRKAMTRQQREIGLRGKVVMVGRDIGTVVLPEAPLKIYLDASAEVRAKRRYDELMARGSKADYEQILAGIKDRDQIDSNRKIAPLKPADDAIIINSDALTVREVVDRIKERFA